MLDKVKIIKKHPSKCWKCEYARNISDKLLEQGYCGYITPYKYLKNEIYEDNFRDHIKADEVGFGWIQCSEPFVHGGVMLNDMLITKHVTKCKMDKVVQSLNKQHEIRKRIEELEDEIMECKRELKSL